MENPKGNFVSNFIPITFCLKLLLQNIKIKKFISSLYRNDGRNAKKLNSDVEFRFNVSLAETLRQTRVAVKVLYSYAAPSTS